MPAKLLPFPKPPGKRRCRTLAAALLLVLLPFVPLEAILPPGTREKRAKPRLEQPL